MTHKNIRITIKIECMIYFGVKLKLLLHFFYLIKLYFTVKVSLFVELKKNNFVKN